MHTAALGLLSKINELTDKLIAKSDTFPDQLCEFIVEQLGLNAVVIFTTNEKDILTVSGKSLSAETNFDAGADFSCSHCSGFNMNIPYYFDSQPECQIKISTTSEYEACAIIKTENSEKLLVKVAKNSAFTQNDKDYLGVLAGTIKNMMDAWIKDKYKRELSLSRIIADVAHELRTPTNSIMGFASLLNEDSLTSSQAEYVGTLKDNAYNLLSLINDIVEIAKIENNIVKRNDTLINIKHFLNDLMKLFKEKMDKNQVDFIINIEPGVPDTIKLDAQKLRYILINILTISLRLTERGKISISVTHPAPDLVFRINDTSAGLTANKVKDIFNPFALTDMGNTKIGSSTGLGLTLSRLYVKQLEGDLNVSSLIGKGNTFSFSIRTDSVSPVESSISQLPKPGSKNRVLVIEDDYATSKLLNNYLTKWGYEPILVNSAREAMKAVDDEIFLAVLMDIVLPDSNGFELLKEIREHKNAKNTPVIVCSVEAEQQKAFLMGAVEYFVKPIKYKFLVEVLQSYKLKRDSNVLVVDDDVPTLSLLKQAVEQLGFNPVAESYPEKVPAMIENMNLDLAIIDLDMPVMNGFELIKIIKSNQKFSKLPIIIYTGKENYKDDLKKIEGLFEDLLQKNSTNIEELSETINQMINRYDTPSITEEVIEEVEGTKILLVEDYKHSQIIVTRLLKKNGFESIIVVENGAEALDQVKKHKFDLILMDMQMPVMNGFEATQRIRQLPQYKDTPIIALTAFAMKGDREKCLDAGATDYIPKPIDSQEFIEKVKFYTESKVDV